MLFVADSAKERIHEVKETEKYDEHYFVRVSVTSGGCSGLSYSMDFDNVDKSTNYSNATAFGSSGTITFTLNAAAATQINNNNDFNIALLLTADVAGEEESPLESDGNISNGIAFSSAINLVYTAAATGYTHKVNTVAAANIGKVNTVATANIGKINTVD